MTAVVAVLAASVTAGSVLAYVTLVDHRPTPSAVGRSNTGTPAVGIDGCDPLVVEPAPASTSIAVERPVDEPRDTAPADTRPATPAPATTVLATTVPAATAPGDPTTTPMPPADPQPRAPARVLYVGDSIAWQTSGALQELLPDTQVDTLVYGGTAPCDWFPAVASYPHLADVVVLSFMGNNLTETTGHATGEALLTQYRDDLLAICGELAPARCVAVGQPALGPGVERNFDADDEPTAMYQREARFGSWEFLDAGAVVESVDGGFDPSMRQVDGVHLNSVGIERFATAIAQYLLDS